MHTTIINYLNSVHKFENAKFFNLVIAVVITELEMCRNHLATTRSNKYEFVIFSGKFISDIYSSKIFASIDFLNLDNVDFMAKALYSLIDFIDQLPLENVDNSLQEIDAIIEEFKNAEEKLNNTFHLKI